MEDFLLSEKRVRKLARSRKWSKVEEINELLEVLYEPLLETFINKFPAMWRDRAMDSYHDFWIDWYDRAEDKESMKGVLGQFPKKLRDRFRELIRQLKRDGLTDPYLLRETLQMKVIWEQEKVIDEQWKDFYVLIKDLSEDDFWRAVEMFKKQKGIRDFSSSIRTRIRNHIKNIKEEIVMNKLTGSYLP